MASGIETLIKTVMRAAGVPNNPVEIIDLILEGQGYTRQEVIDAAFQLRDKALDYHNRLAQIETSLAAISARLGIVPETLKLEDLTDGRENPDDARNGN